MKKQIARITLILALSMFVSLIISACTAKDGRSVTKSETVGNTIETVSVETEKTEAFQGGYTLSECKSSEGVFIAYEDGSFDKYRMGGYCDGLSSGSRAFYGMFMHNDIAENVIPTDANTKLVVFASKDYSLTLHPIHAEVAVFSTSSADGTTGYGKISQMNDMGAPITVYYKNHETEKIYPVYIDGEPASEYEAEHITWTVTPYKGMSSSEYTNQLWGFKKNTSVSLGVGEGTSLSETSYNVDAMYYDCDYEHNNWQDEDIYYVDGIPTSQGYAEVNFSEVPNGRYVMVYSVGKSYWATLLILER